MSLNASLASNYRSNPSTSKRRIPEEFLKSPTNSDTSKAEGNAANNAATDGKTSSAEAVTPIKKIRKKVKLSTEPNSDPQKVNIDEVLTTKSHVSVFNLLFVYLACRL